MFHRDERRTVGAVFATGMCIPFVAGIGILQLTNLQSMWGPNGNSTSFLLVFSIAMAITSIPVISRIMHDLGILDTTFARVVLGVAVLEDLVLYVVLAVAIGYAGATAGAPVRRCPRRSASPAARTPTWSTTCSRRWPSSAVSSSPARRCTAGSAACG